MFLNARQLNAISDLIPLSDLLVGTSNIIWRLWAGSTGTAIGPLALAATPQSYYGACPTCPSVPFWRLAIFAEYDGRRLRDLIYQFAYDKFLGQESTLYCRHLIPFGTQFTRLAYKPDPAAQFVVWAGVEWPTAVLHVPSRSTSDRLGTLGYAGHFRGCLRGSGEHHFRDVRHHQSHHQWRSGALTLERLASREVATIYDYKFMDCCSTYDGRNTSSTTMNLTGGSSWAANDTGTVTASSTAGWATFLSTDVGNEIWLYSTFSFLTSVGNSKGGILKSAVTPGHLCGGVCEW